ncbi:MAG: phosphoribosylaminoimidazolesuccinocarboxamide synthase [Chloroflexi bacterium]|nr:phosphoribosylaminoimidazolesuccinocarboxamide synthase [Chloroflexota bacterium]
MAVVFETQLPGLFRRGKVRDTYDLGDALLMIATDRISAFDVVLPSGIPDKGEVLTRISSFWFDRTGGIVPHHLIRLVATPADLDPYPKFRAYADELVGRSMIVRRAEPFPIECVARGYLVGSGWAEYRASGEVCGIRLPEGLREGDRLPEPIFTPSTKEETGHDINISFEQMVNIVGAETAAKLRDLTLRVYSEAAEYALTRGIIIADTKFEFGMTPDGIILIDEVLTQDSSRFWEASEYQPGRSQPSLDKQGVRDWLAATGWNREPPAPELPADVIAETAQKYRAAYERLTDTPFRD